MTATLWNHRGYTGHEMLDSVQLLHMKGRVYDPTLGMFLSPDPVLNSLRMPQSLNPYGYVAGNPLAYTDPTGLLFSKLFKFSSRALKSVVKFQWRAVDQFVSWHVRLLKNDYVQMAAAIGAGFYTGGLVTTSGWATCTASGATWGGVAGGVAGGAVTGAGLSAANGGDPGDTLRGAFWGGVTGGAFAGVNAAFGGQYSAGRVLADATVGGVSAKAQDGDFWRGFGMSGISSGAEYAYREIVQWSDGVKHPSTWRSGKGTVAKDTKSRPVFGRNNTGTQGEIGFMAEGSWLSEALNKVPGIAAVSGMHDTFQIQFDPGFVRTWVVNVPGMAVAAGMTYPALMRGAPSIWLAAGEED